MILTGKAKEDFLKYYKKRNKIKLFEFEKVETVFKLQDYLYKNALIIEWFDSVGIKILHNYNLCGWYCELKDYNNKEFGNHKSFIVCKNDVNDFDTRQEAIEKAIEKANEIFNQR